MKTADCPCRGGRLGRPRRNGLPRQCEHWLAMTCYFGLFLLPRAAGWGGMKSRSEVPLSVSGMRGSRPRLTALAATLVPPLGSPPSSGVQRTLPLVAFLGSGASRCRWQMKAQRLIRSRASGGLSRSRPAGGIAARRKNRSFPRRERMGLDLRRWGTANTKRLKEKQKKPRAAFAARGFFRIRINQPMLSNSATISSSGALVQSETATIRMLETTKAGSSS